MLARLYDIVLQEWKFQIFIFWLELLVAEFLTHRHPLLFFFKNYQYISPLKNIKGKMS